MKHVGTTGLPPCGRRGAARPDRVPVPAQRRQRGRARAGVNNVVVANGRYVAGGFPVAPRAKLDDGLLDIMLVPAAPLPQLVIGVIQILVGRHLDSELLIFHQAHKVKIAAERSMLFNVDGELVGNQPATFEALPRVLEVVVGEDA